MAQRPRQHFGSVGERGTGRRRQQFRISTACPSRHLHAQRDIRHEPYSDPGSGKQNTLQHQPHQSVPERYSPHFIRRNFFTRRHRLVRNREDRNYQRAGLCALWLRTWRQHQPVHPGFIQKLLQRPVATRKFQYPESSYRKQLPPQRPGYFRKHQPYPFRRIPGKQSFPADIVTLVRKLGKAGTCTGIHAAFARHECRNSEFHWRVIIQNRSKSGSPQLGNNRGFQRVSPRTCRHYA